MSLNVPLEAIPNQSLSVLLGGTLYDLTLKTAGDTTVASITRGGVLILSGVRCVFGFPLIPYSYIEDGQGNLIFTSANSAAQNLPFYTEFNASQFLTYFTNAELQSIRNGN